jgi:predicted phosphoadenosine phosphosulfate sulfurtransferase
VKIYLPENVFDAALDRIRWLFDEFENVSVGFSGGKDSTTVLNLALMVAEEKGRLPLNVVFIDQEAEWQTVIDYVGAIMRDPRVNPCWLQVPIRLFNSTSINEPWLYCWEPGKQWIRDKDPISIQENTFGTDRFGAMFEHFHAAKFPNGPAVYLNGVRAEESPARLMGLTSYETYKGETWGRVGDKKRQHFTMYPIYDWSYTDVWKAIHDNGWPYCPIYDYMYQHGVPLQHMRVSNVHHESAVKILYYLQEIEGATWDKITNRLAGINTVGQLQHQWQQPKELPWMFDSWYEYRDHLIDKLIEDPVKQKYYRDTFARMDERYDESVHPALLRTEISCVLVNDYHGTKLSVFAASNGQHSKNHRSRDRGTTGHEEDAL